MGHQCAENLCGERWLKFTGAGWFVQILTSTFVGAEMIIAVFPFSSRLPLFPVVDESSALDNFSPQGGWPLSSLMFSFAYTWAISGKCHFIFTSIRIERSKQAKQQPSDIQQFHGWWTFALACLQKVMFFLNVMQFAFPERFLNAKCFSHRWHSYCDTGEAGV